MTGSVQTVDIFTGGAGASPAPFQYGRIISFSYHDGIMAGHSMVERDKSGVGLVIVERIPSAADIYNWQPCWMPTTK